MTFKYCYLRVYGLSKVILICAIAAFLVDLSKSYADTFSEHLLVKMPENGTSSRVTFAPELDAAAYHLCTESGVVYVDYEGNRGSKYLWIRERFSPPKTKVTMYVAQKTKRKLVIVFNGKECGPWDGIDSITFSPNQERFAARVFRKNKESGETEHSVVVDGKEGAHFRCVWPPIVFSSDSRKVAYTASVRDKTDKKSKECVVANGRQEKLYDDVRSFCLDDSGNYAYVAMLRKGSALRYYIVVNGKPGKECNQKITDLFLTRSMPVYCVGDRFVVIGRKEGKHYKRIRNFCLAGKGKKQPIYSADIDRKGNEVLVVGQKERKKTYNHIKWVKVSNDGSEITYLVWLKRQGKYHKSVVVDKKLEIPLSEKGRSVYKTFFDKSNKLLAVITRGKSEGKRRVYFKGKYGKEYDDVWNVTFTPDEAHIAYIAKEEDEEEEEERQFVVVDGKEGKRYKSIKNRHSPSKLVFSPDGSKVAYVADARVVAGEKEEPKFSGRFSRGSEHKYLLFSPDSQKIAYFAWLWDDFRHQYDYHLVVDGKLSLRCIGSLSDVKSFRWNPTSTAVAYILKVPDGFKVIFGNTEGPVCKQISDHFIFSDDGKKIAYGAVTEDGIWRKVLEIE
jgi:hypothetical protein